MGQHFLFHRDLVAATAVHHAVNAHLSSDLQADLVLLGPQWLRIYRVEPSPSSESGLEASKGHVLHLVASFPLAGVADSVHVLKFDRNLLRKKHRFFGGEEVLLLTFPIFKWVIVGYDRRSRSLATLAMFSFEEDAIGPGATLKGDKNGREQLLGLVTQAQARVDPQTRCGAMLVYSDQLVIVPFRSESMELSFFEEDEDEFDDGEQGTTTADSEDEEDDEEEKKLEELVNESKNRGVTSDMNNTLNALLDKSVKVGAKRKRNHLSGLMPNDITGREFLLRLRELEITGKIIDLAFLDGYLEPTLMVLHEENERNSTYGRLAMGFDTYCLTVISINMNTRLHPKIWTVKNLPSDCFRLIPCRAPLGGVVVLSANALLYFNQTQFYGLATNVFASKTVNQAVFPLSDAVYETPDHDTAQLNMVLYDCQYEYLQEKELLLTMPDGQVYVLSLPYEDTSSRGLYGFGGASSRNASLSLRMLSSSISANCLCINDEKKTLFVGSRSGDSVLFALDQKKPANAQIEEQNDEEMAIKEEAVKQEAVPQVKADVVEEEEEDEDDLFLYGAAPTKEEPAATAGPTEIANGSNGFSAKKEENDTSVEKYTGPYDYQLRQIDVLPSIGQITSIELGIENNADSNEKREELVISGGYERSGAISVLHNGLRPIVGTEAELNGCRAMWTVSSSLPSATKSSDGRSYNAYLILSVAHRTMVLRTGEGMEPLEDDSGFYTSGPTLAAANLFNKQRIVQIFKQGARVMMEVPEEEAPNGQDKPEKAGDAEEEDDEDEDDGPRVKLVCTQEITLEGDVECGGMNVDTATVGIVSVDVVDPYILLLLTDGSVRLLMGDEDDMELTVIDPEIDYLDGIPDINGGEEASKHGSSSACLFYDWAGMFRENAWGEDEREEHYAYTVTESKKEDTDDDDMDALYSTSKPSPKAAAVNRNNIAKPVSTQTAPKNSDGSVSIPLLKQKDAKMMCGLCFGDGSLHVFSLPDFKKRGVFPYLTFAPQSLVNTLEHYQASKSKTVKFSAPVLGLNASSSSANDGRIKKSHTINSPVADIIIHRVGPSEGQHNAQYLSRMVMLVFLANGDLLTYSATPKFESLKPRANGEVAPVFHFVRVGTDLITRPFLPPKARTSSHNEAGNNPEVNTSAVLAKLRAGFRYPMLTCFYNVNNMSGAFFRGAHPMWIVGDRGQPSFVPMCVPGSAPPANKGNKNAAPRVSVPVLSFTPFHHWNCPNGFIYFHSRGALRVCELPSSKTSTILPSSGGFVLQKAEFGATLHHMLYLGNHGPGGVAEALEAPTYAVVCSVKMAPADAERATEVEGAEEEEELENLDANGNPVGSNVMAPTAEMFPDYEIEQMAHTEEDVYELRLVQTNEFGEWGRRGVFRVHFERYEVVLSIKLMYLYDSALLKEEVASTSPEWNKRKRPYLVIGTGWVGPHGEDESGRGRLLLYELDYAQYVNEEGGATGGKLPKLRLVFIKEHRQGAISMVAQLGPYVLAAVGSKLIVYEFKSEQLIGCAFYDAQMYIVTLNVVKDFVMYGDVYKSVHFLRWREMQRQLVLLAKDYEPLAVSATEFSVYEKKLALLAVDMDENLHVMQYAPQDIESRGGQRLLRVSDFHLGVQVSSMFRKRVDTPGSVAPVVNGRAAAAPSFYVNVMGNSEGGVGALIPISERVFRRLFTLQNVMVNTLHQNGALNPREFRMLKTNAQRRCGRPDAWSKKKWKKSFLDAFVLFRFLQLDYVAQKELARCIGTTPEVVIHNLLEVQHATSKFM
ncbi:Cleavage and polyadenylation specificity factor subunit 1 [Phytophthora citrophthora]|uniref:Cleavage and polyadenylation specificity factor subunit 1 n=1 Tax=Phytophthora citrophthora TaxID=4793 RepID=A0AAD9GTL9_9STRA|nr:Cleavage and polyadenylation specificity factor subunit 1 [Phytophthora citrophthora]